MSTVPNPHERAYPMPAPTDDRRFSLGLVFDVAQVLVDHGYPPITAGGDLVALQQALYGFLYKAPDDSGFADRFLAEQQAHRAAQAAEHYETGGWKGDGPGSCGIECACGVTYDGFDSLAEAHQQLAWHIADPSGQDYGRADTAEADDPTPIGRRVPPHFESGVDEKTVDETEACPPECAQNWVRASDPLRHVSHCPKYVPGDVTPVPDISCSCGETLNPDCRVHASRFRRPCGDPAPHGEHPWRSPTVLGSATWTCPGVTTEGSTR